jgi:hypothetical protein
MGLEGEGVMDREKGISVLGDEGYYDLTPIDVDDEVKKVVKTLMRDWRAWADRMAKHDNEALRPSAGTIRICIYEIETTFKIKEESVKE